VPARNGYRLRERERMSALDCSAASGRRRLNISAPGHFTEIGITAVVPRSSLFATRSQAGVSDAGSSAFVWVIDEGFATPIIDLYGPAARL
jgi:hypothetical protein